MVQDNDKNKGYSTAAYLLVVMTFAVGAGLTAMYEAPHPLAVCMVLATVEMGVYIATEIHHKRAIKTMQTQGRIEVNKIAAAKALSQPSNVINGTAYPIPNIMPPKGQPQLEYRKLIEGDGPVRYLPKNWTYRLSNGSVARGDLIEAIVAAAHDDVETQLPFRDYVRTQYKVEFSNDSYTRALLALEGEGAMDKAGKWLIEHEEVPELLDRMRVNGSRPSLPSPNRVG